MATLTWRNVDAPDFRGSLAGIGQSSNLVSTGLDQLSKALGGFDQQQNDGANQQVLLNALKFSDPAAYAAAQTSGQLTEGVDPKRLNAKTLEFLGSRTGDLLANQMRGEQITGAGLNNTAQGFKNTTAARDDAATQEASDYYTQMMRSVADPDSARAYLAKNPLSDGARNLVTGRVLKDFPGTYGPLGSGSAAPGTPATAGTTAPAATSGYTASIPYAETRDYVSKILGQAGPVIGTNAEKAEKIMPFLFGAESGDRHLDSNGDVIQGPVTASGDRAQGAGQIMPKTARDPGYGVTPAKDNSEAENRRVSKDYFTAMLDKFDGDPEKALAAYNAGPGTVDNWQKENITSGSFDRATAQVATRANQNTSRNPLSSQIRDLDKDERDRLTVATDPAFANMDPGEVATQLQRIQREGNFTPAQAAQVLKNNVEGSNWWDTLKGFVGNSTQMPNLGGGLRVNNAGVATAIAQYNEGRTTNDAEAQRMTQQMGAQLTAARDAATAANQQLAAAEQRAVSDPSFAPQLPRYRALAQRARQSAEDLLEKQRGTPEFQALTKQAPASTGDSNAPSGFPSPEQLNHMMDSSPDKKRGYEYGGRIY